MAGLDVASLSKTYPGGTKALVDIDLTVPDGAFFAVLGPTNAGKSTLLKTIAGVERPDRGRITLGARDVTALQPRERRVSLLFQNIALFPTLTGSQNIAFPLVRAGLSGDAVAARVAEVSAVLKVGHLLDRLPRTFSGGEQQRVAIGRAIALATDLLMLDEPLTNLDARIRIALRLAFKRLHQEGGQTILYVTHDQVEAMSLSDRIAVLDGGHVLQVGSPDDIYHRPETEFVARFIGDPPMNILDVVAEGTTLHGDGFALSSMHLDVARPARLSVGIRPERVVVAPDASAMTPFAAEVMWVERRGAHHVLDLALGAARLKARTRPDHAMQQEGRAFVGLPTDSLHILDRGTGRFIRGTHDDQRKEALCAASA